MSHKLFRNQANNEHTAIIMEVIENVLGRGRVYRRTEELGEVTYDLIVFKREGAIGVSGRISCPMSCLAKLHQAGKATLQLVDGRKIRVIIKRVDFRTETADFYGSGWFY